MRYNLLCKNNLLWKNNFLKSKLLTGSESFTTSSVIYTLRTNNELEMVERTSMLDLSQMSRTPNILEPSRDLNRFSICKLHFKNHYQTFWLFVIGLKIIIQNYSFQIWLQLWNLNFYWCFFLFQYLIVFKMILIQVLKLIITLM